MTDLVEYEVITSNAPYFYYVVKDGKVSLKARQGNLGIGRKVAGNIVGVLLINIDSGLRGEQPPPYAMYLSALELVVPDDSGNGDPEPEPEPGDVEVDPNDIMIHEVGGIEVERFYRQVNDP